MDRYTLKGGIFVGDIYIKREGGKRNIGCERKKLIKREGRKDRD